jgi:vacuolar-type H+-ATPase subunit H
MIKLFDLAKETKAYGKFEMGRVYSNPYHTAFTPQVNEAEESEDHEVSMANNSIDTIIKMATELKAKMGENEKNIPAWIQDHISKAENYISQAASNYHEYGNENVNEGSLYSSQKLTIPQLGQLKIGDKVKYLGKDINGFMSGEEYEVSRRESSSTFQPTITIKNNRGKKLRTTNLSKINESKQQIKEATAKFDFAQANGIQFYVSSPNNNIVLLPQSKKEIEKIDMIKQKLGDGADDDFLSLLKIRLEKKLGISVIPNKRYGGAGYAFDIDTEKLFNKL